jgi:ubiquinone/menaquinone biosynthesis C-methylase UbiE
VELSGNIVNTDDLVAVLRQLRKRPIWVAEKFVPGTRRRVRSAWPGTDPAAPTHFWDVPEARDRRVRLATGDPNVTIAEYVVDKYLGSGLRGLSLGCGSGAREVVWAETGAFASIQCYDISPSSIEVARERYPDHPVLSFAIGDALALEIQPESFDVIIFEDALHHFAPMRSILERCRNWLVPSGYLVANEYVGPRKFQYAPRQKEAAEAILAALPESLRVGYVSGAVKRRVRRPSLLRMRLLDPSEAVESDLILPEIRRRFEVVEEKQLGGTLVSLVLDDIAQHFASGDHEGELALIFGIEDLLLSTGEIDSDYALVIARRPG